MSKMYAYLPRLAFVIIDLCLSIKCGLVFFLLAFAIPKTSKIVYDRRREHCLHTTDDRSANSGNSSIYVTFAYLCYLVVLIIVISAEVLYNVPILLPDIVNLFLDKLVLIGIYLFDSRPHSFDRPLLDLDRACASFAFLSALALSARYTYYELHDAETFAAVRLKTLNMRFVSSSKRLDLVKASAFNAIGAAVGGGVLFLFADYWSVIEQDNLTYAGCLHLFCLLSIFWLVTTHSLNQLETLLRCFKHLDDK